MQVRVFPTAWSVGVGEGFVFAHQLLHPVLAEDPGSGGMGRHHGLDGFGLADRHHSHVVRDSLAH